MRSNSRWILVFLAALLLGPAAPRTATGHPPARWRLLAQTPAAPEAFAVPVGVYDPLRHRVLVFDAAASYSTNAPLVLWSFEPVPVPRWSRVQFQGPAPQRSGVGHAAYDSRRDRLLVVGTSASGTPALWALDLAGPAMWQELRVTGSQLPASIGSTATYDPVRDRLVLIAGEVNGSYDPDLWIVDLSTLVCERHLPFAIAPEGREGFGAVYDPAGRRVIVFGGHTEVGGRRFLNDTWALSLDEPMAWTELSPEGEIPTGRYAFGTVFDPVRRRLIVHGGLRAEDALEPDDVWALTLDGPPTWTALPATGAIRGRTFPVDVYDPVADRLLSCSRGGYPQSAALPLTGAPEWSTLLPVAPLTSPPARSGFEIVYDSKRAQMLVIGGRSNSVDSALWSFSLRGASAWHAIQSNGPQLGGGFSTPVRRTLYDAAHDRVLAFDGYRILTAPAAHPNEWTEYGPPLPADADVRAGAGLAIDTRRDRVIVSGGYYFYPHSGSFTLSGVYALPLQGEATWSKLGLLPQYAGASDHSMFYDPNTDRLLVTGGGYRPGRLGFFPHGGAVWSAGLDQPTLQWTIRDSSLGTPSPAALANTTHDPATGRLYAVSGSTIWSRLPAETGPWTPLAVEGDIPNVVSRVEFDPALGQLVALWANTPGSDDVQAWAIGVRPLQVELEQSARAEDRVELAWRSVRAYGEHCTIERREAPGDWTTIGSLEFDVRGLAQFTDVGVQREHDYAYRVRVGDGDSSYVGPATLVTPPDGLRLAVLGARPNPAVGAPSIVLSLPGEGRAALELFDVTGRRCATREVGMLGAGRHTVSVVPDRPLDPGVYFVRLRRGDVESVARVVIAR